MKKLITIISYTVLGLLIAGGAMAQSKVKVDATGNYVTVKKDSVNRATGKTFTDSKGNVYPVFISSTGKLYYMKTAKSGNVYKAYIKVS